MGNHVSHCFTSPTHNHHHHRSTAAVSSLPLDDGLGHSFYYLSSSAAAAATTSSSSTTTFSLSGASVSANTSTPLSTSLYDDTLSHPQPAAFDSSNRFSSLPLQPIPLSGPISSDRSGFLSGPIERAFLSGPINPTNNHLLKRSISGGKEKTTFPFLRRAFWRRKKLKLLLQQQQQKKKSVVLVEEEQVAANDEEACGCLQWAQGKAGEDRVHVVVSEEHGWVFVGIYDGFNGPDATDYLQSRLYPEIEKELKGLLDEDEVDHMEVLKGLDAGLRKTEETFFDCADLMATENPELALMGSCVLVMVMKGEDVYLMNVGDSRALLAQKESKELMNLQALQLTLDHSTSVQEEVVRIRKEHPEDSMAISNGRVKGSLKVTRAFGAGFLKQPKWNNALLEMFRIDYIGNSPYITCNPSLYHHKVAARDKFLILSSDGLYQYFTNEEVVTEVEQFIASTPEGDPAQHLIEEMLFRAAKKAGMDFHELLEIPQGDRRRYHDDVSIIVISLEGRIWRSCM